MAKAPPTIAATSTLAMIRTAEARGVETEDLLAAVGLAREFLEDPDARLPGPTVLGLWNALRQRTGDPALQLVAPTSLPFGAYRVIDYLVGASATVGDGIRVFARFFQLIADALALTIEQDENAHCLRLATADGGAVPPVYVDYVFAALVSRIRMRIRPSLRVQRVELRQREPQDTAPYTETFRAPVNFGAAADRLCFSAVEWQAPMDSADAELAKLLEEHARIITQRLPRATSVFQAEVQRTIASVMPEGGSAEDVARALHCSVRTLQRKLAGTGLTFREASEVVRGKLAEEYLADGRVSIAEVAFMLASAIRAASTGRSDAGPATRPGGGGGGERGRYVRANARCSQGHMTQAQISGISPFFIVGDLRSALSFYRDRLGFEITFEGPADAPSSASFREVVP